MGGMGVDEEYDDIDGDGDYDDDDDDADAGPQIEEVDDDAK